MAYRYISQFKMMLVIALAATFGAHKAAAQTPVTFPVYYNGVSIGVLEAKMSSATDSCGPGRAYTENSYYFGGWFLNGGGFSGGGGVPTSTMGDVTETSGTGCPALGWTPTVPHAFPFTSGGYLTLNGAPVVVTDYEVIFYGTIGYLTYCAHGCS